jgi:large subunit ribosomal protein L10Ae
MISQRDLVNAVNKILDHSNKKKRNFLESLELQIGLKNYDPKKDKRFSGSISVPHTPKEKKKVAIIGDAVHLAEASNLKLDSYGIEDLKKFNKKKKTIKKFAKKYDFFLASDSVIKIIPRILGPGLNKVGKFPSPLSHSENLTEKISILKRNIKFELKKVLCLGILIGNVGMKTEEITQNLMIAINFLASLLKKNWQNIGSLHIKSTMGPPVKIF